MELIVCIINYDIYTSYATVLFATRRLLTSSVTGDDVDDEVISWLSSTCSRTYSIYCVFVAINVYCVSVT